MATNNKPTAGLTYRGRPVEELTKEELIAAFYRMHDLQEDLRRLHEGYVELQREIREMR